MDYLLLYDYLWIIYPEYDYSMCIWVRKEKEEEEEEEEKWNIYTTTRRVG